MSKEEFLKIQTWVLKVYIHCDGCDRDVKKTLGKIAGVLTVKVDKEQNKVTVSGTAAPPLLIKKLKKKLGKHAELLNAQKSHKGNPDPPIKDIFIDDGKGGNKDRKEGGNHGGPLYLMAP
ncbi:hypothetical protein EUGRSUZ_H03594 [Eucalyptus grandis]|uniref:Uncharacterized protein n=2 Tax=Eucalyptus grandis TaxID=71139 RepID=A0ACC3JV72_EUCGR|nr:hypothetical protein EUGRSUZ_H03594 [Eucalyptus grandis]